MTRVNRKAYKTNNENDKPQQMRRLARQTNKGQRNPKSKSKGNDKDFIIENIAKLLHMVIIAFDVFMSSADTVYDLRMGWKTIFNIALSLSEKPNTYPKSSVWSATVGPSIHVGTGKK